MAKRQNLNRGIGCLLAAGLLLTSGCGPREAAQGSSQPGQDIEILYHADDGEYRDIYEDLSAGKGESPAEAGERIVITFAAAGGILGSLGEYTRVVEQFNKENEKYFVEMTEYDWNVMNGAQQRIAVEIGSGSGPDLLMDDVFPVNREIMDSGILVDLTPYLESSGITPENFFPGYASAVSGDRIYGVSPNMMTLGLCVDEEVLGDREPPEDLETLVDMLLEYPGHGSLLGPGIWSRYILKHLLEGSEDLWGMIDWEEKTCDFSVPLFSKILEVTKRYREDGKNGYEPVICDYDIRMYQPEDEALSDYPGMVPIGFFFDDGPHYKYQVNGNTLMINANTEHLEGAYAFVSYVLCQSGQNFFTEPVNKASWEGEFQELLKAIAEGRSPLVLNEEIRQEALEAYEDARFAPRRTEEILEIVYEVSESYFEGDKSKEEVIELIQNRVQLYLNENK